MRGLFLGLSGLAVTGCHLILLLAMIACDKPKNVVYERIITEVEKEPAGFPPERFAARQNGVGRSLDELVTTDGKSYQAVTIQEVSAIGITIRHDSGSARIPFERLAVEMQQEFYFDPREKEQALAAENEMHAKHESSITAIQDAQSTAKRARNAEESRKLLASMIATRKEQIHVLEREKGRLELELNQDRQNEILRRQRGNIGISRAPVLRESIAKVQSQIDALRQQVTKLQAEQNALSP